MGLTIDVLEDGGLTLTSDDGDASNMRVADCFGTDEEDLAEEEHGFDIDRIVGYDGTDYWQKWMNTPADGATVVMDVSAEDSIDVLSALEDEFFAEAEAALEALKKRGVTS